MRIPALVLCLSSLSDMLPGADNVAVTASVRALSTAVEAGGSLPVLVRLKVPAGWHIYWRNSGEAGMATRFKWSLPEGWKAQGPQFPVPERFESGGIVGFGYSGEVAFPAILVSAAGSAGETEARLGVEWLACNDKGCVPGRADLSLQIRVGIRGDGGGDAEWRDVGKLVPAKAPAGTHLQVERNGQSLRLTLRGPVDLSGREVFAATPHAIDDGKPILFKKVDGAWTADVERSQYAGDSVDSLELVFSASKAGPPFSVAWAKKVAD